MVKKEDRVVSRKVEARARVRILVRYKGNHIYRVYVLLKDNKGRGKIMRSLHVRFDEGGVIIDLSKEPRIKEININEDIVKNTVSKVPLLRVLNPDREETRDEPVPTEIEEAEESSPNYKAPSVEDSDEEEEVSFYNVEATPFGLGD